MLIEKVTLVNGESKTVFTLSSSSDFIARGLRLFVEIFGYENQFKSTPEVEKYFTKISKEYKFDSSFTEGVDYIVARDLFMYSYVKQYRFVLEEKGSSIASVLKGLNFNRNVEGYQPNEVYSTFLDLIVTSNKELSLEASYHLDIDKREGFKTLIKKKLLQAALKVLNEKCYNDIYFRSIKIFLGYSNFEILESLKFKTFLRFLGLPLLSLKTIATDLQITGILKYDIDRQEVVGKFLQSNESLREDINEMISKVQTLFSGRKFAEAFDILIGFEPVTSYDSKYSMEFEQFLDEEVMDKISQRIRKSDNFFNSNIADIYIYTKYYKKLKAYRVLLEESYNVLDFQVVPESLVVVYYDIANHKSMKSMFDTVRNSLNQSIEREVLNLYSDLQISKIRNLVKVNNLYSNNDLEMLEYRRKDETSTSLKDYVYKSFMKLLDSKLDIISIKMNKYALATDSFTEMRTLIKDFAIEWFKESQSKLK